MLHGRRRRRPWRVVLVIVGILAVSALGGLAVTFGSGPVSMPYLAQYLSEGALAPGARLRVGAVTIDLSEGLPPKAELLDLSIEAEADDGLSLQVPRVSAPLDPLALLQGEMRLSEIRLEHARLSIANAARSASSSEIPDMAVIAEAADRMARLATAQLAQRGIARIELVSAEIVAEGEKTYRMRGIDAELTRADDGTLQADAEIAGRLGQWKAKARRSVDPETGESLMRVDLYDVTLGEFVSVESSVDAGKGLGIPVRARLDVAMGADRTFDTTRAGVIVSPGWINTGHTVVGFDKIDIQLYWEAGTPGFRVVPSLYQYGNTVLPFEGLVEPPREWQDMWSFRIVSRDARIGPSDVAGPPFEMEAFLAEGRADLKERELHFDKLALRSGAAEMDGAGSVRAGDDGLYMALAVESGPMSVASLKRLWPITMMPPARAWVIEHLVDGRIDSGRAMVSLRPAAFDVDDPEAGWSGDDVQVDIAFSDLSLSTVGTVPVAQGLSGRIHVADEVLTVTSSSGVMVARPGEQIAISDTVFQVPDLRESGTKTGVLKLTAKGPAKSLATLLDAEPFTVLSRNDLAPEDVAGSGAMTLNARFALVKDVRVDDVDWDLSGSLKGFSNSRAIRGHKLSGADLTFDVDEGSLSLKGRGKLDGLPANLDLVVPFDNADGKAVAARQGVVIEATAAQLAERGIDIRGFVNGPLKLTTEETEAGQSYQVDLTRASIELADLGWSKSPGVAARAQFRMSESGGQREIRGFRLTSEGVEVEGNITLTAAGDLERAEFSRFALRASDDASLRLSKRGKQITVDLRANRLDARGLVANLSGKGGPGGGDKTALKITAEVGQLIGFNGVTLSGVSLSMSKTGGDLRALDLSGSSGGRSVFQVRMTGEGAGREVTGTFQDTGAILRFANLYQRMRGGVGILSIAMPTANDWNGNFKIKRLAITEDPAIQALARSPAVLDARDPRRNQVLAGVERRGEASFSVLELVFRRSGDMLTVTEGTLAGPTIGGTVSGNVDLATRSLDMTGTFVPAFAINNLFAKIPILGFALGGGADEGLIGVTYRLTGSLADPVLTVNPASAMAPGIFRKIFEYR